MPAIEFSRLRTKIELLGRVYDRPEQFLKDLNDLYFFYSDLTFQTSHARAGKFVALKSYRAPTVINRELERLLRPRARSHPQETLQIADLLWESKVYEPCLLAASLLGNLPISESGQVLERIQEWSNNEEKSELLEMLLSKGTETIRRENPDIWIKKLQAWLLSKEPAFQKLAILGLHPLLNDPDFNNLPIVFDLLQPVINNPDPHLALFLLNIIDLLQVKSETETVYFLKQIIQESKSEDLPRFIRRALPSFTEPAQQSLKTCLKENQQG